MKVSEKLSLAERLAAELQARYDFSQATVFLKAFIPSAHTYWND